MSVENYPSVLSFQRGMMISDGMMYNYFGEGKPTSKEIFVVRHGVRGTQNVGGNKEKDVYNPQITETAKTEPDAQGLVIRYSIGFLPLHHLLSSTSEESFNDHCKDFVNKFVDSKELLEVSMRYARNILNGRWFYRNTELEISRKIKVTFLGSEIEPIVVNSETSLQFANGYTEDERKLGKEICKCFKGISRMRFLVEGIIDFGFKGALEVFPSQNYVHAQNKPKGFARPLYKVGIIESRELNDILKEDKPGKFNADMITIGYAALRDQKIGNALRTIDTWYENGDDVNPIPIEPNGASLKDNKYYRKNKNSAFKLFRRIDELNPGENGELNKDAMFVLASMVRGGVLGEKGEKE